ncbi:helix-turn-helix domain-containing protein [Leucobacter sp. wl10]|uniref:helix-turn-helix domain-containing protein n=1 Tax=Leucobacter sp. wl10 TaxID=2304677 RepID=UPI000E5A17AB|nr:helix-turn-helix domain-containing protein [Leucobacter sp. wl10]RGE19083.1 DNA-binding protein [Leucobacter sp. wl10]
MTDAEYWDALADPVPVRELAPLFRVHESTVHRHLQNGTIPGHYIGRSWIVYKCEIRAWLADRRNISTGEVIDDDPLADWPDELRMRDLTTFFGKTKQTIRAWLEDGEIPGYQINGRWVAYKAELREVLAATSNQQHS